MSGFSQTKRNGSSFGHAGRGADGPANGKDNMFASLTAGLLARKGEASPASAHLDGMSIHSLYVHPETTQAFLNRLGFAL